VLSIKNNVNDNCNGEKSKRGKGQKRIKEVMIEAG
jgi:hypothetical protein